MRYGRLVSALAIALLACAAPRAEIGDAAPPAGIAPTPEFASAALEEARRLVKAGDSRGAAAAYDRLIASESFADLPSRDRHDALVAAAGLAYQQHEMTKAQLLVRRACAMDEAGLEDWRMRLGIAYGLRDIDELLSATTKMIVSWPAAIEYFKDGFILQLAREARSVSDAREAYYAFLTALFDARWRPHSGAEPDSLWIDLASFEFERNHVERAAAVTERIQGPRHLIALKADRRLEPIVQSAPDRFDIRAACRRNIAEMRTDVERAPRSLASVNALGRALLEAGRLTEALELWDRVLERTANPTDTTVPYDDVDEERRWAMNNRAEALSRLGRWPEAVDQMDRARRLPEHGRGNISQTINLADMQAELGRPKAALATLRDVGVLSAYGRMQLENVRVEAAVQLHDTETMFTALSYLREHAADAPDAFQGALIAADRKEEAAKYLIARLEDVATRYDALAAVQFRAHRVELPMAKVWNIRWTALLKRPDVRRTLASVARVEYYLDFACP